MKYPVNPAYLGTEKLNQETDLTSQTFLDYCRQQNIPFNKADATLYELNKSAQNYQILKVLFDQVTINKPLSEALKNDQPVKLTSGELHLGWPSRMDTPQEMIKDFKEGRRHPILVSPERKGNPVIDRGSTQSITDAGSLRSPLTARLSTDNLLQYLKMGGSSSRLLIRRGS